ncbi:uncharacterized protein LOC144333011 [Macaca mulatta]
MPVCAAPRVSGAKNQLWWNKACPQQPRSVPALVPRRWAAPGAGNGPREEGGGAPLRFGKTRRGSSGFQRPLPTASGKRQAPPRARGADPGSPLPGRRGRVCEWVRVCVRRAAPRLSFGFGADRPPRRRISPASQFLTRVSRKAPGGPPAAASRSREAEGKGGSRAGSPGRGAAPAARLGAGLGVSRRGRGAVTSRAPGPCCGGGGGGSGGGGGGGSGGGGARAAAAAAAAAAALRRVRRARRRRQRGSRAGPRASPVSLALRLLPFLPSFLLTARAGLGDAPPGRGGAVDMM